MKRIVGWHGLFCTKIVYEIVTSTIVMPKGNLARINLFFFFMVIAGKQEKRHY
jgi:hypothetical protein